MVAGGILAAACASFAGGCASTGPRHAEVRHPGGALAKNGPLVDGLQHGEWTVYHADGTRKAQGRYENDVRTGTWTHWHENGRLRMRGAYRGEREEGLWEFWYDDGSPHCRGEYRAGREHGEWTFWHRGGAVQQRGVFWNGRRELRWTEYDPAGRPVSEGSWLGDRQVGEWRRAGPDGGMVSVVYPLPAGVEPVLERWDDGSVRREGFVRDGVPDGVWVTRHRGGALRAMVAFAAGQPAGELVCCRADGSLVGRGALVDGRPGGEWRVRGEIGETAVVVPRDAQAPWDRQWSDAAIAEREPPLAVVARWLAELRAPPEPVPVPVPSPAAAAPVPERLEAPTDPGEWTEREREELRLLLRYYRDGWLPRRHSIAGVYGAPADAPRLGSGDAPLAAAIVGRELPVTRFPTPDGEVLDLAALRGKRVLFVMLSGYTSRVCIACYAQTVELAPLAPRFAGLGCEVVVLYPGSRSKQQAFAELCAKEFAGQPPPYRMVYDPDLDLARALGLQGNLARPATFAIDRDGVVRAAYVAESERNLADRPSAEELLRWIEAMR